MSIARTALLRASKSTWLASQMTQRKFARRAVKKFMPGETLPAALEAAQRLSTEKIGSIVTRLGETLTGESNAHDVRDHYIEALGEIAARKLPAQLSVKPTQLGLDQSAANCLSEISAIVQRAEETESYVWIDMEDSTYVDRTLDLYEQLRSRYPRVGVCLQSYLYRTPKDVERLLPINPSIRLVKGAYAEPASVAFPAKRDTDSQYVSLSETLLAAANEGKCFPVFGTHDMNIVHRVVGRAESIGLNASQFEVHMLYGIRSNDQRSLASRGTSVRCLISYGENWFPWYMRRLAERPANVWFVVKSTFA